MGKIIKIILASSGGSAAGYPACPQVADGGNAKGYAGQLQYAFADHAAVMLAGHKEVQTGKLLLN